MFEVENHSSVDFYVTILELGPDGSITTKFPYPSGEFDNMIPAKQKMILPLPFIFRQLKPYGRSLFKAIATFDPVNFSPLIQQACLANHYPSTRSPLLERAIESIPERLNPLAILLSTAFQGQRAPVEGARISSSLWATAEAWLDVKPAPAGSVLACPQNRVASPCE